jgi:hypothetical protein
MLRSKYDIINNLAESEVFYCSQISFLFSAQQSVESAGNLSAFYAGNQTPQTINKEIKP